MRILTFLIGSLALASPICVTSSIKPKKDGQVSSEQLDEFGRPPAPSPVMYSRNDLTKCTKPHSHDANLEKLFTDPSIIFHGTGGFNLDVISSILKLGIRSATYKEVASSGRGCNQNNYISMVKSPKMHESAMRGLSIWVFNGVGFAVKDKKLITREKPNDQENMGYEIQVEDQIPKEVLRAIIVPKDSFNTSLSRLDWGFKKCSINAIIPKFNNLVNYLETKKGYKLSEASKLLIHNFVNSDEIFTFGRTKLLNAISIEIKNAYGDISFGAALKDVIKKSGLKIEIMEVDRPFKIN